MSIALNQETRMYYWTDQRACGREISITAESVWLGDAIRPADAVWDEPRRLWLQPGACIQHQAGCARARRRARLSRGSAADHG